MWREERRLWHSHHHNAGGIRVASSSQSLLVIFVVVVLLGSFSSLPSGNAFCVQPLSSTTSTFHRRLELERSFLQDTNLVVVGERRSRSSMPAPTHLLANSEPMQVEEDGNRDDDVVKPLVEPNTHDELMYALGVNLARQLGDVRPLVESAEELTQVAKGLLDTVIGRVTEETQKELLVRRGKELNALITDRAYVSGCATSHLGDDRLFSFGCFFFGCSRINAFICYFPNTETLFVSAWNERAVKC